MRNKPKIVVICGPTAVGKTFATLQLAELLDGEIVSADSMQIYRYMDIGTAKPTADEKKRATHHMIDIVDPDEFYDAARFSREARAAVYDISNRNRLALIAGGTGFYIKSLLYGLCDASPEDLSIRARLKDEAETAGGKSLYRRLEACDPNAAQKIHPNDTYRVIRALEVYEAEGMPISEYRERHMFTDAPFDVLQIGLFVDRQTLYKRIEMRIEQMIDSGLHSEVRGLKKMGYHENLKSMQSLGYRHTMEYIRGNTDWDTAVATMKRDTRQYAKRQLTWFKRDRKIKWFAPDEVDRIASCVQSFLGAL